MGACMICALSVCVCVCVKHDNINLTHSTILKKEKATIDLAQLAIAPRGSLPALFCCLSWSEA